MTRRDRMIEGARNYALADRSDPFALARAMVHINNGIAGYDFHDNDAFYNAEPTIEVRHSPGGETYNATVYRNVTRP